jgi:hypothetical protein
MTPAQYNEYQRQADVIEQNQKRKTVMQKEFIPYEQALELKEIEFDEECLSWYNIGGVLLADISIGYEDKDLFYTQQDMDKVERCTAPTFSQAFRWFRGKFKIISTIHFYCDGDKWEDVVYEVRISEFEYFKTHDSFVQSEFKTYEEAELACLKKLIEIVKNK